MEQGSIYSNIAVVGLGAAGGFVSILLSKNPYNNVVGFDIKSPLSTLLPTGGGRCNLTNNEENIRDFVKNYPRGEKFLLSVFSKCDNKRTIELFKDLGIKTYVQGDNRVFPVSDSSAKTVKTLNSHLETSNFTWQKEKVLKIEKRDDKFLLYSENKHYEFDKVIIATGGKGNGFELAKKLGHNVIEPQPSLSALNVKENNFYKLSGLSFKNVEIKAKSLNKKYSPVLGDFMFSHKSITGPVVFKISALSAYDEFPLELTIKFADITEEEINKELQNNAKKSIKNVYSKFLPISYMQEILLINNIDGNKQVAQITKKEKEILYKSIVELKLTADKRIKDSEIVTAGGVDLKEINPKTMESKLVKGLYFVGEILDIDGFTGGFNLQNCWSTAYVCSSDCVC